MASTEGGMDIETVAATAPQKIVTVAIVMLTVRDGIMLVRRARGAGALASPSKATTWR